MGFDFKQVKRVGMIAMFEKRKDDRLLDIEVIKIGSHNGFTVGGTFIEPSETYPSNEQWGEKGFSCGNSRVLAEQRFTALLDSDKPNGEK